MLAVSRSAMAAQATRGTCLPKICADEAFKVGRGFGESEKTKKIRGIFAVIGSTISIICHIQGRKESTNKGMS